MFSHFEIVKTHFNDAFCDFFLGSSVGGISTTPPKHPSVASFTKEVNRRLAKCPLKTSGRLANLGLTSLEKEATGVGVTKASSNSLTVKFTQC